MTIVVRNPVYRLISIAVSLIIVAVLYFAVTE
jgi:NADH:ubiquinone oxidoreductase subunit 6 (subunit J)